jgi:hypothetical protein
MARALEAVLVQEVTGSAEELSSSFSDDVGNVPEAVDAVARQAVGALLVRAIEGFDVPKPVGL